MITHDLNMLLEQYNLANHECDGDFEDYYWTVSEWIGQHLFTHGAVCKSDVLDFLCELLDVEEDGINVDDVEEFLDEVYQTYEDEKIKG